MRINRGNIAHVKIKLIWESNPSKAYERFVLCDFLVENGLCPIVCVRQSHMIQSQ